MVSTLLEPRRTAPVRAPVLLLKHRVSSCYAMLNYCFDLAWIPKAQILSKRVNARHHSTEPLASFFPRPWKPELEPVRCDEELRRGECTPVVHGVLSLFLYVPLGDMGKKGVEKENLLLFCSNTQKETVLAVALSSFLSRNERPRGLQEKKNTCLTLTWGK